MKQSEVPGLVLVLGGGGAAGLAHIGVLQVLAEEGIPVRAVAGTSIGAEVGAFVASGMSIADLAAVATSFDWKKTLQLFLPDLPTGGLISGVRIVDFLNSWIGAQRIEDLAIGYLALATDLHTGEAVILDRGDLVSAVRASISVPGIVAPFRQGDRWLVDGGVVNPLPFDVARAHFGGPVVAVAVHSAARHIGLPPGELPVASPQWPKHVRQLLGQSWMRRAPALRQWLEAQVLRAENQAPHTRPYWTARRVLDRVLDVAEAEIVRLRASRHPPDLILAPPVADIGFLEFYRSGEAIAAGRCVATEHLPALRALWRGVTSGDEESKAG